jgi:3-oxoadipate enol-lactonase
MRSVEVHHELIGPSDSPVLVLAGPLGSTLEIWEPLVTMLVERFRILRYDHRGHGRSPVPSGPYAIADLAADALALLWSPAGSPRTGQLRIPRSCSRRSG